VRDERVVINPASNEADGRRRERDGWRRNRVRAETRQMTDETAMIAAVAIHRRNWRGGRIAALAGGQSRRRKVMVVELGDIALQDNGENQQAGSQQPAYLSITEVSILDVSRPARHLHVSHPCPRNGLLPDQGYGISSLR
jgi:hypothetical protein